MDHSKILIRSLVLLAVLSLASCDTAPSTKPLRGRTLTLLDGDVIIQEPASNALANVSTPVVYR
jgi:hypothetical protein